MLSIQDPAFKDIVVPKFLRFKTENLPVAESICTSSDIAFSAHLMEPPYVIKPVNEGSSVGVHLVMQNNDNFSLLERTFVNKKFRLVK